MTTFENKFSSHTILDFETNDACYWRLKVYTDESLRYIIIMVTNKW